MYFSIALLFLRYCNNFNIGLGLAGMKYEWQGVFVCACVRALESQKRSIWRDIRARDTRMPWRDHKELCSQVIKLGNVWFLSSPKDPHSWLLKGPILNHKLQHHLQQQERTGKCSSLLQAWPKVSSVLPVRKKQRHDEDWQAVAQRTSEPRQRSVCVMVLMHVCVRLSVNKINGEWVQDPFPFHK